MKLHLSKPRILCHVNSGANASFWHDNWTELGSLTDINEPLGPQVSGIPIDSSVAEAVLAGARVPQQESHFEKASTVFPFSDSRH